MPKQRHYRNIYQTNSAWVVRIKKVYYGRFYTLEDAIKKRDEINMHLEKQKRLDKINNMKIQILPEHFCIDELSEPEPSVQQYIDELPEPEPSVKQCIDELEKTMVTMQNQDFQIKTNLQKLLQSEHLITKLTKEYDQLEQRRLALEMIYNNK